MCISLGISSKVIIFLDAAIINTNLMVIGTGWSKNESNQHIRTLTTTNVELTKPQNSNKFKGSESN